MALRDLLKVLPANERTRLERAAGSQKKLLLLYSDLRKSFLQIFQGSFRSVPAKANPAQLRILILAAVTRRQLDARIAQLNRDIESTFLADAPDILDIITRTTRAEIRTLDLPDVALEPVDPRVLEVQLIDAIRRTQNWNKFIRPELIRDLTAKAQSGASTKELASMISQSVTKAGYTPPVTRAQHHMLQNTRYAVVSAANAAREATYLQLQTATGLPMQKMWLASILTCCRSCALLHGQIVDVGTSFAWENLGLTVHPHTGTLQHPPLHPNCRCRIIMLPPGFLTRSDLKSIADQRDRRVAQFV